jgi:predicted transcriptional regulator of viral defense system
MAALAAQQHGVIAVRQLHELGIGRGAVRRRIETARLHRLYVGVYAVGHRAVRREGRWLAAVLACGPEARLSYRSAGANFAIRPSARERIDVTVPSRGRRQRPGIQIHSARHLDPADVTEHRGIPTTSLARTLLDLATFLSLTQLDRAIEAAERLERFDLRAIDDVLARSNGHRGAERLRRALGDYHHDDVRSDLEAHFLELCREADLPLPATNILIEGFLVDAVWREQKPVVELDGYRFHRTRSAFERDRRRDAMLALAGYRMVRVTHLMLERESGRVAEALRALLQTPDRLTPSWRAASHRRRSPRGR